MERIQAELDGIDQQVEAAAEQYNGAQYELGKVQERIGENRQQITDTTKALKAKRVVLAQRLRDIYATPEPSLAEVLITSGSISAAADQVDLLDRVGQRDADVVGRPAREQAEAPVAACPAGQGPRHQPEAGRGRPGPQGVGASPS